MSASDVNQRTVLFLQGPPSPFWYELADAFQAAGARTLKINLSTADWVFWRRPGAVNYRGRRKNWPRFLRELISREGVTDIIYFSDRFPYHVAAREVAEACGINAHAVEFGYLRPGWLTLEKGGMGAFSHFPNDPLTIRAVAENCGSQPTEGFAAHKTSTELTYELLFHLLNEYWRVFFPFFRSGRVNLTTVEFLCGLVHSLWQKMNLADMQGRLAARYYNRSVSFNLLPLQLQTDYQIRENTAYKDQNILLREVIRSFSLSAPTDRHLLIKLHPLDPGMVNWNRHATRYAAEFGVSNRVYCFDGGNLSVLIEQSEGIIVSNSTVGLMSIRAHRPTLALGDAIYDMPGLTHQGSLDSFWNTPQPVEAALCAAFVTALVGTIQVRGSVYDPKGRREACAGIVARVTGETVNGHGAYVAEPPRLSARRQPFQNQG